MRPRFTIWRYFLDGMPTYLARHYWWAYLWQPAIRFFDRQPIINAILFGQYQRLLDQTLACLKRCPGGRLLQLTCVYGKLTPSLMQSLDGEPLYLVDVAPQQQRMHWLHRFWPSRWLITCLEPFLDGFWHEDLAAILQELAQLQGKGVKQIEEYRFFNDFYRVVVFEVTTR